MNKILSDRLIAKYPSILDNLYLDINDGWYNIIDSVCETVENHINMRRSYKFDSLMYNRALKLAKNGNDFSLIKYYTGKIKDINNLKAKIERDISFFKLRTIPESCQKVIFTDVKEKYGSLRIYYFGGDDFVNGAISMAEKLSSTICETCGAPGELRGNSWFYTSCQKHSRENNNE